MAESEDQIRLRLTAETFGYRKAWADVRVQTARDLANIKSTVATSLNQARESAAQNFAAIKQNAAAQLGQTRIQVAAQLAQIKTQTARDLSEIRQNTRRTLSGIGGDITGFGSQIKSAGAALTVGLTAPLAGLAAISTRSALQLDTFRNRLTAIEGSAEAAGRRIAGLRKLAQESVGVTTKLSLDTFAQFSSIGGISESVIEKQIKSLGRLNAVFDLEDPVRFSRNQVQIFTQSFERQDIKEALGQVPIFEQLLEQAFGTRDPAKLRELKNSGKLTLDSFLAGIAEAVESNPRLAGIGESLSVRLQKTFERIQFALAPIGETILRAIEPFIEPTARLIDKLGAAFASLPRGVQVALVALGGIAAVVGPAVVVLGALVGAVGAIVTAIATVGAPVVAGVAAIVAAVTVGAAALVAAWQTNFGGIQQITERVLTALGSFVRENVGQLVLWWQQNLPLIRQTVETVLNAVQRFWDTHGQRITAVASAAWKLTSTVISTALSQILNVVRLVMQVVNADWSGAWETFKAILARALDGAKSILASLTTILWNAMKGAVATIWAAMGDFDRVARNIGTAIVVGIVRGIASTSPQTVIAGAIIAAVTGAGERAKTVAAQQGAQAGQEFFNSFNRWVSGLGRTDLTGGVGEFVRKPAAPGEGEDEKARKKAARIADRARETSIKAEATAAETAYQQAVEAAKRAFDETRNLAEFIGAMKKAEADRWKAREEQFKAEREQIRLSSEAEAIKSAQIKVSFADERQAHAAHILRMTELDEEHTEKSLAELQRLNQRARELDELRFNEYVALQKHLAEQDRITNVEANERINRETLAFFGRRLQALLDEAEAAKGNAEALAEINHQIAVLKEESEAFMRGDKTRIGAALSADADEYLTKLTKALELTKELLRTADELPLPEGAITRGQGPVGTGPVVDNAAFEAEFGPPPAAAWMTFGDVVADVSKRIGDVVGVSGSVVSSVFSGMGAAIQKTVQAFGGLSGVARNLGDFFRAVVKNIRDMAVVQALWEAAQALAAWALSFFWPAMAKKAALHTQAAIAYGVVAGAAGALSAAVGSGGGIGAAGALADGGAAGGDPNARESERARREREAAERDKNTKSEERRGETLRLAGPVIVQLDGREVGRGVLNIVRDGGDMQDDWRRALGYSGG